MGSSGESQKNVLGSSGQNFLDYTKIVCVIPA